MITSVLSEQPMRDRETGAADSAAKQVNILRLTSASVLLLAVKLSPEE